MAVQVLTVYDGPFQGGTNGMLLTDLTTAVAPGVLTTITSTEIKFNNDGYTLLLVKKGAAQAVDLVINSVPDNANRVGPVNGRVEIATSRLYGPFTPLWWNFGGMVSVTFSTTNLLSAAAIRLTF